MNASLSPEDRRRAWLAAALIVLMMLLTAAAVVMLIRHVPRDAAELQPPSAALLDAARGLDEIRVEASLSGDGDVLTMVQTMTLRNRTGQDQPAVVLRSWSGAYLRQDTSPAASDELFIPCYGLSFDPGGLTLSQAEVNGQAASWRWLDDASTVLEIGCDWPADSVVNVTLHCRVQIPDCASRFGHRDGIIALGNVFPVPAVWQEGAWRTDPYCSVGDPFLSECCNWSVTLTAPEEYTVCASAPGTPGADGTRRFTGLALRDFALVLGRNMMTQQQMAGDVLVTACARNDRQAKEMLRCAVQAMQSYASRWGDYAWPAYTLCEVPFPYGGMEYPGLVMIATDALTAGGDTLAYAAAHETAHQWWSVMVGSDSFHQPWQDEALCEYAWLDYVGDVYGPEVRSSVAFDRVESSLRITVPRGVTPGSPIDYFSDLEEYTRVVYQRGAALWTALETHLGKDGLDALLRDYQTRYRFGVATREDLTQMISQHCGQDMSALMLDYLDTCMQ